MRVLELATLRCWNTKRCLQVQLNYKTTKFKFNSITSLLSPSFMVHLLFGVKNPATWLHQNCFSAAFPVAKLNRNKCKHISRTMNWIRFCVYSAIVHENPPLRHTPNIWCINTQNCICGYARMCAHVRHINNHKLRALCGMQESASKCNRTEFESEIFWLWSKCSSLKSFSFSFCVNAAAAVCRFNEVKK